MKINILMDVDDVVADLVTTWLYYYNQDYNDNVAKESILEWNLAKYLSPKCGDKIYEYLDYYNLYKNIQPLSGAVQYLPLLLLENKFRIIYVTAQSHPEKVNWLKRYHFLDSLNDYVVAKDKSIICGDILVDDNADNLISFVKGGKFRRGYLFTQPWNLSYKKLYKIERVNNWIELYQRLNLLKDINE